jgi:hypothetical protein
LHAGDWIIDDSFQVLFQVIEIEPAYTMLLGRPWIHAAVPSTLHQRVKYVKDGCVITVYGEDGILVSKPVSIPYVDNIDQEEENLWHSLEIVEPNFDGKITSVNQVVARIMAKNGYEAGKGLGLRLQGDYLSVSILEKFNKFRLGYKVTLRDDLKCIALSKK